MGSKLILLLGLIIGGVFIFFCVNDDKREIVLSYKNSFFNSGLTDKSKIYQQNINSKSLNKVEDKIVKLLRDNPIYFKINSTSIRDDSKSGLNKIILLLKELPNNIVVRVEGHTDTTGEASFNKKLSQKRADSVKLYLQDGGVNNLKIIALGRGEEQPLIESSDDNVNRRVEIYLQKGE